MPSREIELALRRGQLQERSSQQRRQLAAHMQPLAAAFDQADHVIERVRQGADWVRQHPGPVLGAVAVLAAWRPRRVWSWGKHAFVAWRAWRSLRARLSA